MALSLEEVCHVPRHVFVIAHGDLMLTGALTLLEVDLIIGFSILHGLPY